VLGEAQVTGGNLAYKVNSVGRASLRSLVAAVRMS
jgi:hypothetical protein